MVSLSFLIFIVFGFKAFNIMYNKEGVSNWYDIYFV